ncbi:Endonuclease domain-containing 1 protein [Labeo rohita]|uniref:Endonuclease domain-containing 1 protein n=1 Tax=Labeo rohita TaxID=84645 RepID=A0ABQ8LBD9_LABRO|nr:Endonuclease domain-containing 1 protein [Labeo rohita]
MKLNYVIHLATQTCDFLPSPCVLNSIKKKPSNVPYSLTLFQPRENQKFYFRSSSFIMKPLVFLLLPYLSLSEVVSNFDICNQFFLNEDPPQFTPSGSSPPNEVKHICQCLWDDSDEQKILYATLYSTTWKIPIYSAYVFGSPNIGRCDVWYIEPQDSKEMTGKNWEERGERDRQRTSRQESNSGHLFDLCLPNTSNFNAAGSGEAAQPFLPPQKSWHYYNSWFKAHLSCLKTSFILYKEIQWLNTNGEKSAKYGAVSCKREENTQVYQVIFPGRLYFASSTSSLAQPGHKPGKCLL